jgi:hypothetical protein
MGEIAFGADGVGAMARPAIYDRDNVDAFATVF